MSQIPQLMSGRALEHGIAMAVDHGGTASAKMYVGGQANADVAAGTALTGTTNETALASYTIPANTLVAGSTIKIRAAGLVVVGGNGNIQLQIKLDDSSTAIGSAVAVANSTATASLSTNDIYDFDTLIQIRNAGATGTGRAIAISDFFLNAPGTTDVGKRELKASFDVDTTVDNLLQITGDLTHADDSVRSDIFIVDIVNPST